MHPKKVIAERAHKWEPRGKRMNRASRRRQEKNINTYCHTRWSPFSPLDRHYPSIAATSNLAPFSSLSLLTGREGRCSCDTHRDGGWYTKLYKMVTRHSRSNSFFPPFSPQRMHRIYFTITLRKLLSNTHFDDIRTQVTRFFPCSNLTEKNHVVTRSTSTITENIDTCDLFIYIKSRENRYWSRTDACVPIVTLCCTEKRKNCRLQHWRAWRNILYGPVWHTLRVAHTTFARCRLRQTECRESLEASVRDCCAPGGRYLTYSVTRLWPVSLCSDSLETGVYVRRMDRAHVKSNPTWFIDAENAIRK